MRATESCRVTEPFGATTRKTIRDAATLRRTSVKPPLTIGATADVVTLGAAMRPQPVTTITGYWLGLAKRSFQVA